MAIREIISGPRGGVAVDDSDRPLYNVYGSYREADEGWVATSGEIVDAEPTDHCVVKCSNSEYKVGLDDGDWPCGWKRREDGKQFLARPTGVTIFTDLANIEITEAAQPYLYNDETGILDCGFTNVVLKLTINRYGIGCHTTLKKELYETNPEAQYFGIVWEMNDPELVDILTPRRALIYKIDDSHYVEYIKVDKFLERDSITGELTGQTIDVEHDYVTTGGNLTTDTTWTAGTYYLTSDLNTHNYNFCLDCSAGNIIIKTNCTAPDSTNATIFQAGYGNMWTANTDAKHKVIFTSMHDNSQGETIAGSSGHPAAGDQLLPFLHINYSPNGYSYYNNMSWCECWYCVIGNYLVGGAPITTYGLYNSAFDITWTNWIFKYCSTQELSTTGSILCNLWLGDSINSITLKNISIDNTNYLNSTSKHYAIFIGSAKTITISDIYINMPSSGKNGGYAGIATRGTTLYSTVITNKNCFVSGKFALANYMIANSAGSTNLTTTIRNCIAENLATGAAHGFWSSRAGGTVLTNIYDSIAINCDGVGAYGYYKNGVAAHTVNLYNCGAYNNTLRVYNVTSDNSPIDTDPQLGNLPDDVLLDNVNSPHPDGLAVRNLPDYEKKGSDTFNNLGIDEQNSSMTGYMYAGTDLVTPGIYYYLEPFRPKVNWWV